MAPHDPEKSARADDMVAKLEAAIAKIEADLDKARAAGNEQAGQGPRGEPRVAPRLPRDGPQGLGRVLRLTLRRPTRPRR